MSGKASATGSKDTIIDMVGKETDLSTCLECRSHPDCFAWAKGRCTALTSADDPCVFYKSTEENNAELRRCYQRLKDTGRTDLLKLYKETNIALGLLDEEITALEDVTSLFDEYSEMDFQKKLAKAMEQEDGDLMDDDNSLNNDFLSEDSSLNENGEEADEPDGD